MPSPSARAARIAEQRRRAQIGIVAAASAAVTRQQASPCEASFGFFSSARAEEKKGAMHTRALGIGRGLGAG